MKANSPKPCYHGGAFFDAIGVEFDSLERRHDIINADVLDAWFPPSPKVIAALQEDLPWVLRTSPPTNCEGMARVIARARGVSPENILPAAGSSDAIFLAFRQWLTPSSRVLILDPTYGEYAHVLERVIGCRVMRLPLLRRDDYRVNLDELQRLSQHHYDLIVLVNPNSPTGQHIQGEEMEKLLRQIPTATRVWIDETYVEFAERGRSPSAADLNSNDGVKFSARHASSSAANRDGSRSESLEKFAAKSKNVVVCKSMSKVYALSGARAAYLCGPAETLEELRATTPPWAVSLPAQIAAVAALHDPDYYAARYVETHRLREELVAGLSGRSAGFPACEFTELSSSVFRNRATGKSPEPADKNVCSTFDGWEILPGLANFVLCHLPQNGPDAATLVQHCRAENLFLRNADAMGRCFAGRAVRIAVKDSETNQRMLEILQRVNNRLLSKGKSLSSHVSLQPA